MQVGFGDRLLTFLAFMLDEVFSDNDRLRGVESYEVPLFCREGTFVQGLVSLEELDDPAERWVDRLLVDQRTYLSLSLVVGRDGYECLLEWPMQAERWLE